MADGQIRIEIQTDSEEAKRDLKGMADACSKTSEAIRQAGHSLSKAFTGSSISTLEQQLEKANDKLKKTQDELTNVQSKIQDVASSYEADMAKMGPAPDLSALFDMEEAEMNPLLDARAQLDREAAEYQAQIQSITAELAKQREAEHQILAEKEAQNKALYDARLATAEARADMAATKASVAEQRAEAEKAISVSRLQSALKRQDLADAKAQTAIDKMETARKLNAIKLQEAAQKKAAAAAKLKAKEEEKARKAASGMTGSLKSGIKTLGKMAVAVVGIQAAYSALRQAASRFLQDNEALQSQLDACWNVVAQAVGPVVEIVVNGLTKAIAYVAAFIKALTGIDLVAKANAAALKKQAAAAKESAQVAGFDEINKLSDSGNSSSAALMPSYDFNGIEFGIERIKAKFAEMAAFISAKLAPSVSAWSGAWTRIKDAAVSAWPTIEEAASGLLNGNLKTLGSYIIEEWAPQIANSTSTAFAPFLGDILSLSVSELAEDFKWLCGEISANCASIAQPALETLGHIWDGICTGFKTSWEENGEKILSSWKEFKEGIREHLGEIGDNFREFFAEKLIPKITELWDEHLGPLWEKISGFLGNVWTLLLTVWNKVLQPIFSWIWQHAWPVISHVLETLNEVFGDVFGFIADTLGGLLGILGGVCEFIVNLINGDLKGAANAGIKILNSLISGVVKGVQDALNVVIDLINGIWGAVVKVVAGIINSVGSVIKWLGDLLGKDWGWEVGTNIKKVKKFNWTPPQIPYLARGGIVNNPGRGVPFVAGEAGAEAVLPLDRNTEWMDVLAEKVNGGGQPIVVQVILNGRKIQEEILRAERQRNFALNGMA